MVVVLGLFAATGYTGYRLGYARGMEVAMGNNTPRPGLRPFDDAGPRRLPRQSFSFERGVPTLALILGYLYWLLTRSGWRLTRQTTVSDNSSKAQNE